MSLIKVSKGHWPKALDDFPHFSVLCQVGCFTDACCYQSLMSFVILEYNLSTVLVFVTFKIPGSRYIVQVVQTVEIDLQKFRFTEHGSN